MKDIYDNINSAVINSEKELIEYIKSILPIDAIVVEGYDGVGKGRVLNVLADYFNTIPYRPDYNLWQKYDHRTIDRWKVSGFFWDVYSHFNKDNFHLITPMLFDRGVISGSVYNNDESIAFEYKNIIRDREIMHILVSCDEEDFKEFCKSRNPEIGEEEISIRYDKYLAFNDRYIDHLKKSGVRYIRYNNKFQKDLADTLSYRCEGCGHYSYGWCRHPSMNCIVDKNEYRCLFSLDKEAQDIYDAEMHEV